MKKTMIAAAVGAAMLVPFTASANPVVYGKVDVGVMYNETDSTDGSWDVVDGTSRLGVKGSEDLGNGMSAIYQFEFSVDASDSGTLGGRLAYAGISGGFGTVAVGRQWTPYYNSVDKTDIFNVADSQAHYLGPYRVGNAVAYVSPTFSGVTVTGALIMAANGEDEDLLGTDVDIYNVSVDYANGPLSAGFSYLGTADKVDATLWGLAGSYNFGSFALIGQYENADLGGAEADAFGLGGEVYLGNNTIRAVYGNVDPDGGDSYSNWTLGVEHALSKRTALWAEYESADDYDGSQTFALGLRHDF